MKRGSPLRRKKPLQAKPGKSGSKTRRTKSRSKRKLDPAYLSKVRALPCCAIGLPLSRFGTHDCLGGIEAHHAGRDRGVGQKAPDDTAIPLCMLAHRCWHVHTGVFGKWTKEQRRAWADERIRETQRTLGCTP